MIEKLSMDWHECENFLNKQVSKSFIKIETIIQELCESGQGVPKEAIEDSTKSLKELFSRSFFEKEIKEINRLIEKLNHFEQRMSRMDCIFSMLKEYDAEVSGKANPSFFSTEKKTNKLSFDWVNMDFQLSEIGLNEIDQCQGYLSDLKERLSASPAYLSRRDSIKALDEKLDTFHQELFYARVYIKMRIGSVVENTELFSGHFSEPPSTLFEHPDSEKWYFEVLSHFLSDRDSFLKMQASLNETQERMKSDNSNVMRCYDGLLNDMESIRNQYNALLEEKAALERKLVFFESSEVNNPNVGFLEEQSSRLSQEVDSLQRENHSLFEKTKLLGSENARLKKK